MSNVNAAVQVADFEGLCRVHACPPVGMISVRGTLNAKAFSTGLLEVTGHTIPETRRISTTDAGAIGWMSPDELLLICDYADAPELADTLAKRLSRQHALVSVVSDARQVFDLSGPHARDVIAKLAPVDFDKLAEGELRRTRFAQVPAAFWATGPDSYRVVCFRSVAKYMWDLLCTSAHPASAVHD